MKCRVSTQTTCPSQKVGRPFMGEWNFHSRSRTFGIRWIAQGFGPSRSTSLGPELLKDTSFGSENSWSSYMKDIGASHGGIFEKKTTGSSWDGGIWWNAYWMYINLRSRC